MDLNSRIQKVINYSELSSSEFADEIGVQRSNISHILSGRNRPSLDFLIKIKDRFPEIQWEWLIEGKGTMVFSDNGEETLSSTPFYSLEKSKINDDKDSVTTGLFSTIERDIDKSQLVQEKSDNIPIPLSDSTVKKYSENTNISDINLSNEKENQENKIKKIVFFYENGKFEVFDP